MEQIDQLGVQCFEAVVIQPVLRKAAHLEVLYQHIGLGCHTAQQCLPFGMGHVDGDGALVAVAGGEVAGLAGVVAGVVL